MIIKFEIFMNLETSLLTLETSLLTLKHLYELKTSLLTLKHRYLLGNIDYISLVSNFIVIFRS